MTLRLEMKPAPGEERFAAPQSVAEAEAWDKSGKARGKAMTARQKRFVRALLERERARNNKRAPTDKGKP